ncbi:MAG TPA: endolytic transglycosylase MltG [Burkholderiales bacterium]|nr:endolytic transglycosylase MltG [Burkholderiales bacterium]
MLKLLINKFVGCNFNMIFNLKKTSLLSKAFLVGFIIIAFYVGYVIFFPHHLPKSRVQLIVNKDQNIPQLAAALEKNHLISSKNAFLLLLRLLQKDKKITAGLYNLNKAYSMWGLIRRITNGKPDKISFMIVEGWTFEQLKASVDKLDNIQHLSLNMSDKDLKNVLKIDAPNLEGLFFPSTYFIAPNQTDFEIYHNAYKLMQNKINSLFESRTINSYYKNPYQMLIMASLIQKETAIPSDMYLISTVFNNRLRLGMKLQDDPAVFYGAHHTNGKPAHKIFVTDTPYNTYIHYGLPPTPIAIPSENALKAASQPLDKPRILFFVAIGAGKTKFSNTYREHAGAVNKYVRRTSAPEVDDNTKDFVIYEEMKKRDEN